MQHHNGSAYGSTHAILMWGFAYNPENFVFSVFMVYWHESLCELVSSRISKQKEGQASLLHPDPQMLLGSFCSHFHPLVSTLLVGHAKAPTFSPLSLSQAPPPSPERVLAFLRTGNHPSIKPPSFSLLLFTCINSKLWFFLVGSHRTHKPYFSQRGWLYT